MASTTTDDGFHEIQLNGKQLVFLFMAVTVVSVVIFLCGVLVGRGVRMGAGPTDPLLAQEGTAPPVPELPSVAAGPTSGPPATANEKLTYPNHLANANPPREQLRDKASPPPSPPPQAVQTPAPPQVATAPAGQTPRTAEPLVRNEPAGPGFAIQVAALRQRQEADDVARRLIAKGYEAYVLNPAAGAPAVYRVRVGKFKDRREADSVSAKLQKEEQFRPWVVR